jgi:hypothetical protein
MYSAAFEVLIVYKMIIINKSNIPLNLNSIECDKVDEIVDSTNCLEIENLFTRFACINTINDLNNLKDELNDKLKQTFEEPKVFYFQNRVIYTLKCVYKNKYEIIHNDESCTKYIKIKYRLFVEKEGLLTKDEIIVNTIRKVNCNINEIFLYMYLLKTDVGKQ